MDAKGRIRGVLREPLVHFLLAGFAVFLFFGWRGYDTDPASREIIIDEAHVERLAARFEQTWQRAPIGQEIDAIIRDDIKEEVYYREAMRLGLDRDDAIIRRRMRSKMEFLARSELENIRPSDAALQDMVDKNPVKYSLDASYSFDQIYIKASNPGAAKIRAKALRGRLNKGGKSDDNWQDEGDDISLPRSMENAARTDIAKKFGDNFTAALSEQTAMADQKVAGAAKWKGPLPSGFGYHLVRIRLVESSAQPKLADIRQNVENDWRANTIKTREANAYQTLLDGYTIRIAKP